MKRSTLAAVTVLLLAAAPSARAEDAAQRLARADGLHRMALERIARNTFDQRRAALHDLEQATLLDPENAEYALTLGRLCLSMGHLRAARERFEAVARLAPEDAGARLGLGLVWRRDWLKFLDRTSLLRASDHLREAVRLDPALTEAWLTLSPLLVEQGELRSALAAAAHAAESSPARPEPLLAMAYTGFRLGQVGRADSLFARAIPRLPSNVRERFLDIAPVATAEDTFALHRLPPGEVAGFLQRFWKRNDPDLATPENEAQLEYWSRVAHAYFLFYDNRRREWDERGEVYVRYGPPSELDYNPLGMRLSYQYATGPGYPCNVLVWNYPELGMRVVLEDRTLNEFYRFPISLEEDPDPLPDLARVDSLGDRVTSGGGRAVFPALPPGVTPRPVESLFAVFGSGARGRALGALATPGVEADSLVATFVALDSAGVEVARERRAAASSACEPNLQVADFAATLGPGRYQIGVSVSDRRGRRGLARRELVVGGETPRLELSDLVLTCGAPESSSEAAMAGVLPNVGARVGGAEPLTAYFEIHHLATAGDGRARFQYEVTVRPAERDRRLWIQRVLAPRAAPAPVVVSREEENAGNLRRQVLSVPLGALAAGRYRLEVRVTDILSGEEARRGVDFQLAGVVPDGGNTDGAGGRTVR